jgi:hypothetical protein
MGSMGAERARVHAVGTRSERAMSVTFQVFGATHEET